MKKVNLLGQQLSNDELKNVMAGASQRYAPWVVCQDGYKYYTVCMPLYNAQQFCYYGAPGVCATHGGMSSCLIPSC